MEVDRPQGQRVMEDFWKPVIIDNYSAVRQPEIEVKLYLSLSLH